MSKPYSTLEPVSFALKLAQDLYALRELASAGTSGNTERVEALAKQWSQIDEQGLQAMQECLDRAWPVRVAARFDVWTLGAGLSFFAGLLALLWPSLRELQAHEGVLPLLVGLVLMLLSSVAVPFSILTVISLVADSMPEARLLREMRPATTEPIRTQEVLEAASYYSAVRTFVEAVRGLRTLRVLDLEVALQLARYERSARDANRLSRA